MNLLTNRPPPKIRLRVKQVSTGGGVEGLRWRVEMLHDGSGTRWWHSSGDAIREAGVLWEQWRHTSLWRS